LILISTILLFVALYPKLQADYIIPEDEVEKINYTEVFGSINTVSAQDSSSAISTNLLSKTVNLFTGQLSESFALISLDGRAGIGYNLALHYNSNISKTAKSENYKLQASPFGLGFSIGRQSITVDHNNTALLEDDKYRLAMAGSSGELHHVENNRFITDKGDPWIITRHVDTINGFPAVIGWQVIKDDGTKFQFGDMTGDLTGLNATRTIMRFGHYVGSGVTNDDQPYPFRWDLKRIYDSENLNWVELTYQHETTYLEVMDTLTEQLTISSFPYTQASYLSQIMTTDSSKIVIDYDDREDFQSLYGVNIYEFYFKKRANEIYKIGPTGDTLLIISFRHDYLNPDKSPSLNKLILRDFTVHSGDRTSVLPSTRFQYCSMDNPNTYGRVKKIFYPMGAVKDIVYGEIDDAANVSLLDTAVIRDRIWGGENNFYSGSIFKSGNMFFHYGDTPIIGAWDGYWLFDTLNICSPDSNYLHYDEPAPSADGWIALYDRCQESIIVKRWMGGYWKNEVISDQINRNGGEQVYITSGRDCFVAVVGTYSQCDINYPQFHDRGWAKFPRRAYYYRWDGKNWNGFLIEDNLPADYHLDAVKLYGNMFGISYWVRSPNYYRTKVTFGTFDFAGDSLAVQSSAFFDFGIRRYGDTEPRPNGRSYIIGPYYVAYIANSQNLVYPNQVHLWRFQDGDWSFDTFDQYSKKITAICALPNGFAWSCFWYSGDNDMFLTNCSKAVFMTSDQHSFKVQQSGCLYNPPYAYNIVQKIYGSSHSVCLQQDYTGNTSIAEWNGAAYDSSHITGNLGPQPGGPRVFELHVDSYAFGPGSILCRYLGNGNWTSYDSATCLPDSVIGNGASSSSYYLARALKVNEDLNPDFPDTAEIYLYHPFYHGDEYERYVIDAQSSVLSSGAKSSGFYAQEKYLYRHDMFYSGMDYESDIFAYRFFDDQFKGKPNYVVVDSIVLYDFETDSNPAVQTFTYFGGKLDRSGSTPHFAKIEVSTPFALSDGLPDGYTMHCFFNDIDETGFYDSSIYIGSLNGDMPFPHDLTSAARYGISNGGYRLDGRVYYSKAYSREGESNYNWPTETYYFYSLYNVPDSESVKDVYRIHLDSSRQMEGPFQISTSVNEYDPYNGKIRKSQIRQGLSCEYIITDYDYAYNDTLDLPTANALKSDNAISQISAVTLSHDSCGVEKVVSKTRDIFGKHGSWQPVESYTWRDVDVESDTIYTGRALQFDEYGNMLSSMDANGTISTVKYDYQGIHVIAEASNCSTADFLIQDFEQDTAWDGWNWMLDNPGVFDAPAFTGRYAYRISEDEGTEDNLGPWRRLDKSELTTDKYYYSCWAEGNEDILIYCRINGDPGYYHTHSNLELDNWKKIEGIFDLSSINFDTLNFVDIQLAMKDQGNENKYVNFDAFRFHPLNAHVATSTYDPASGIVTSESDINNIPVKYSYNQFHALAAFRDFDNRLTDSAEYYLPDSAYTVEIVDTCVAFKMYPSAGTDTSTLIITHAQEIKYEFRTFDNITHQWAGYGSLYKKVNGQFELIDRTQYNLVPYFDSCFIPTDTFYWYDAVGIPHQCPQRTGCYNALPGDTLVAVAELTGGYPLPDTWSVEEYPRAQVRLFYTRRLFAEVGEPEGKEDWDPNDTTWTSDSTFLVEYKFTESRPYHVKSFSYNSNGNQIASAIYYDETRFKRLDNTFPTTQVTDVVEYDARGRIAKKCKPYYDLRQPSNFTDYSIHDSIIAEIREYYNGINAVDCNTVPYVQYSYHPKYRGRLNEIAGPGADWMIGSGHTTLHSYKTSVLNNSVTLTTIMLDPDDNITETTLDHFSRMQKQVARYNNELAEEDAITTTLYNDIRGLPHTITTGHDLGETVTIRRFWYDALGQQDSLWRADSDTVRMIYDKMGNMRFIRDKLRGNESQFVYYKYDRLGRVIEEGLCNNFINSELVFNPDSAYLPDFPGDYLLDTAKNVAYSWIYDYDFNTDLSIYYGAVAKTESGDGEYWKRHYYFPFEYRDSTLIQLPLENSEPKAIVHNYDTLSGRIEKLKIYPYDGSATGSRAIRYIYDDLGRVRSLRDSKVNGEFKHGLNYAVYDYNASDQSTELSLGHYIEDTALYDLYHDSLLHRAQLISFAYNPLGLVTEINNPDNVVPNMSGSGKENSHFGMRIHYTDGDTSYFNGRIARIVSANSSMPGDMPVVTTHICDYLYNGLGWLTEASEVTNSQNNRKYEYNFLGNRTEIEKGSVASVLEHYWYNPEPGSSRLDSITSLQGKTTFSYDAVGNLHSIPERSIASQEYDHRNLLTYAKLDKSYHNAPDFNNLHFSYNGNGLRIKKQFNHYWRESTGDDPADDIDSSSPDSIIGLGDGSSRATSSDPGPDPIDDPDGPIDPPPGWNYFEDHPESYYLYDGDELLAIFDERDSVKQLYINDPNGCVAVYSDNNDNKLFYFLKDQVGSTRMLVNNSGAIAEFSNYFPFGQIFESKTVYDDPLKFTGKERDKHGDFDYHYFGARYYDPELGMFTTTDPMADSFPALGPYTYANNDPLGNVDREGRFWDYAIDAVSVGLSAKDFWDDPSWANAGWLALDVVTGVIPVLPAVGLVRHAGKIKKLISGADKVAEAAKAGDKAGAVAQTGKKAGKIDTKAIDRGLSDEAKVLDAEGLQKNRKMLDAVDPKTGEMGQTMPDAVRPSGQTVEVKSTTYVSDSKQLRRQSALSDKKKLRAQLIVGEKTKVSRKVLDRMDVRHSKIIYPQK
jgi:RHS repeat-associated protein